MSALKSQYITVHIDDIISLIFKKWAIRIYYYDIIGEDEE